VLRAAIYVCDIGSPVSCHGHLAGHFSKRVFSFAKTLASARNRSVLPGRSDAPSMTYESRPAASIFTILGIAGQCCLAISFKVVTSTFTLDLPLGRAELRWHARGFRESERPADAASGTFARGVEFFRRIRATASGAKLAIHAHHAGLTLAHC